MGPGTMLGYSEYLKAKTRAARRGPAALTSGTSRRSVSPSVAPPDPWETRAEQGPVSATTLRLCQQQEAAEMASSHCSEAVQMRVSARGGGEALPPKLGGLGPWTPSTLGAVSESGRRAYIPAGPPTSPAKAWSCAVEPRTGDGLDSALVWGGGGRAPGCSPLARLLQPSPSQVPRPGPHRGPSEICADRWGVAEGQHHGPPRACEGPGASP